MKRAFLLLARVVAFVIGAHYSSEHIGDYWYVGPIFGAVVLCWYASAPKDVLKPRSLAFVAASTLIYAAVWWIAQLDLPEREDVWSTLEYAVLFGSILLPIAHGVLLQPSWARVRWAMAGTFLAYYLIGYGLDWFGFWGTLPEWFNAVFIWQGAYLLALFGKMPRVLGSRRRSS